MRDYGINGQIGLEPTLKAYHERLLEVTAECMRVLKPTGVMFWVHGDSYASSGGSQRFDENKYGGKSGIHCGRSRTTDYTQKCMLLQNERLIIKMIDDQGWILRNRIIWSKSNSMPSSVSDRFSNKYEPVYMLVKQKKYWFDLDAVRVPAKYAEVWSRKGAGKDTPYAQNNPRSRWGKTRKEIKRAKTADESYKQNGMRNAPEPGELNAFHPLGKNPGDVWDIKTPEDDWKQLLEVASEIVGTENAISIFESYMESRGVPSDVWTIPTHPTPFVHFATFPPSLIESMIKASCPAEICPVCGLARGRITEPTGNIIAMGGYGSKTADCIKASPTPSLRTKQVVEKHTTGWTSCNCNKEFVTGVVLDPFSGAGTSLLVARDLGRSAIGIEISEPYCQIIKNRLDFAQQTIGDSIEYSYEVVC